MKAINLKTEYLHNPLGIDMTAPRFYWNCEGGKVQTAYRIVVKSDDTLLWDSGKVPSSSMTHIRYGGAPLVSRQRVVWNVTLWDENNNIGEPESAFFEMGLLRTDDWKAKWITGDYKVRKNKRYPADCFKKEFDVGHVLRARLYITACGLYEANLNGKRVGNFVLAPGHTDYRKRIQYQTYDVSPLMRSGTNTLTVSVADGWYRGSIGAWGLRNQYGKETKLLAQLELTLSDGSIRTVCTDGTWNWSNDGPVRFADNKDGERIDATKEPTYSGMAKETSCAVVPSASNNVYITEHETFKSTKITTPSGKTVLDFGCNIAGFLSFSLNADAGEIIRLRFGEMLDADGEFTQKNIQCATKKRATPLQQVIYTCKDGQNDYKTRFAVFGFRYVLVEADAAVDPDDFTAIAVYSDMRTVMRFESSNELLNKFAQATLRSAKNNSADVPTDCPTRERHGWTGDIQIFFGTAAYLLDYAPFAEKYLRDVFDWQKKDGRLPQIAPYGGVDFYMWVMNGSVGWSDVGILMPWRFYKIYGDKDILETYYSRMQKYAGFMIKRIGKWFSPMIVYTRPTHVRGKARKYVVNYGQSYGEWAEPADVHAMKWTDIVSPHPEVSTAYTSYVLGVMAEISEALGKSDDAEYYRGISEKCRESYRALVKTKEYTLDTDRQAQLVRPLYMNLLDAEQTSYAKARLIRALENYGWRLGTGFLSTPLILYVLGEYNPDAAYRLLENEEMPGWLFMPKMGATTIWESWEGTGAQVGVGSLDHYSKGACLEWVFSEMCGISVSGENHFRIAPKPGGTLTFAEADYQSIYGRVSARWEKTESGYTYTVTVPANCTAELCLPDGKPKRIDTGTYRF